MKLVSISEGLEIKNVFDESRDPLSPTEPGLLPSEASLYRKSGFFARSGQFPKRELAELLGAIDSLVERVRAELPDARHYRIDGHAYADTPRATVQFEHGAEGVLRVVEPFSDYGARFRELLEDPRLTYPAKDLLGSVGASVFTDKLNLKGPQAGPFGWHQDAPYWAHACPHLDRLCNVMLALEDADEENGCLQVQRGSHRAGILPGRNGGGRLDPLFTADEYLRPDRELLVPLSAGDLFFFDPFLVHGSDANGSSRSRRALVLTYQPGGFPRFRGTSAYSGS